MEIIKYDTYVRNIKRVVINLAYIKSLPSDDA